MPYPRAWFYWELDVRGREQLADRTDIELERQVFLAQMIDRGHEAMSAVDDYDGRELAPRPLDPSIDDLNWCASAIATLLLAATYAGLDLAAVLAEAEAQREALWSDALESAEEMADDLRRPSAD
ncbi:hypothetical protein AB0N29_01720 [Nocardioides sp. NPDC092400]|uniref:hypothetical protein n=1 Tax=Nocardioides sp. NPDC092400 TaxID=3155196 RepID=UPI00344AE600